MKDQISITMGMDIAALRKSMEQASQLVQAAVAGMKKAFIALAAATGVALGFREIAQGIGQAVRRGKELDMLARETGRTAEEIALLTEATHRAELSMADAADIAQTLGNNWREAEVGATGFAGQLSMLGIKVGALQKMSMPEQFALIAERINQIKDPVVRAKMAFDLLGDAGRKAVANYQSGDLQKAAELLGKNAKDLAGASGFMARIADAWSRIKRAGEVLFNAIAAKIAPILMVVAEKLEGILPVVNDFGTRIGLYITNSVKVLYQAFKEKKLTELLKRGLEAAFRSGANYLLASFKSSMAFIASAVKDVFGGGAIGTSLKEAFWAAVWAIPKAWAEVQLYIAAGLMTVVQTAFGLVPDLLSKAAENFSTIIMSFMPWWAKALKGLYEIFKSGKISFDMDAVLDKAKQAIGSTKRWMSGQDSDTFEQKFRRNYDFVKTVSPIGWIAEYAGKKFEEHIKAAAAAFKDADFSKAFDEAVVTFKRTVGEDPFKSKEAWNRFKQLNKGLVARFGDIKLPDSAKRPGEGGVAFAKGKGGEASFDEFRRVGGGIGSKVSGIQQRMLDKLSEIAANTKAFGERRNTGGSQMSIEMGAVR